MNEQPQYKWLPSEPVKDITDMIKAYLECDDIDANIIYEQLWMLSPDIEQKPAVYLVWHNGEFVYTKYPEEHENIYEIVPLYTHPQPKREPLSEIEIEALEEEALYEGISGWFERFVRLIEKAHGIGVE